MNLVLLKTTSSFGPHYLTWPSRGLKLQPTFIIRADWFSKSNILRLNLLSFSTTWSAVFWMLQRPALTLARSLLAEVRSFRIRWQLLSSRVTRTLNSPDSLSVTAKQSCVSFSLPSHSEKLIYLTLCRWQHEKSRATCCCAWRDYFSIACARCGTDAGDVWRCFILFLRTLLRLLAPN